jgi:hypothetical protein
MACQQKKAISVRHMVGMNESFVGCTVNFVEVNVVNECNKLAYTQFIYCYKSLKTSQE